MLTKRSILALVILAVLVACLPALHRPAHLLLGLAAALGLVGTITVNYLDPGTGTTAPTSAQALLVGAQTLQLGLGDSDTTQVITHNWGLTAAQLAKGFPCIQHWHEEISAVAGTGVLTFVRAANTITVNKGAGTGSGGTWGFMLHRPHSLLLS